MQYPMPARISRRHFALSLSVAPVASALAGLPRAAQAQVGSVPLRIIHGFAPGASDVLVRVVADELGLRQGRPVVFENRPGAADTIGLEAVLRSSPDGNTIGSLASTTILNLVATQKPLELQRMTPLSLMWESPNLMVINPAYPGLSEVRDLKGLLQVARQAGDLAFTSAGHGGTGHLTMEWIAGLSRTKMTHIAYKGSAPAMTDLVGGQIGVMMSDPINAGPYLKQGRLRLIAVSAEKRPTEFPDTPTIPEQGFPGVYGTGWVLLYGPGGMPRDMARRFSEDIAAVLGSGKAPERMRATNIVPQSLTPEQTAQLITREYATWRKVIDDYKIKLD